MRKSLREIAEIVGGVVEGDESVEIEGVCGIKDAGAGQITFLANPKYLPMLESTGASAVIVAHDAPACGKNLIRTDDPYLAFTRALRLFVVETPKPKGIHPGSVIGKNVIFGKDVALHAGALVEDECRIGDRSVLYPGVFVGKGTQIGADCTIYPRVVIYSDVIIGSNVIIHSGAVIGSRPRPGPLAEMEGYEEHIAGTVIVEDDVEIGAGVTIDCARRGATIIGHGTKIDNLVQIGADSTVGCNCIIVSQSVIGSNCKMGNSVTMAGQSGMLDGVSIGDGTIIAAKAGVLNDIEGNQIVSGVPAFSHERWLRIVGSMKRLPTMIRDIREFKKRLSAMDEIEDEEAEDHQE